MVETTDKALSPIGRGVIGLLFGLAGLFPFLAAFDVGPLRQEDINGPPWLGAVAGGMFMLAGVAVSLGEKARDSLLSHVIALAIIAGFAAVGNWIAFGPGLRECSGGVSGFFFSSSYDLGNIECRSAFGIGAGMVNGMLLWMLAGTIRKLTGPGLLPDLIEKLGKAILLLSLLPILLPLVAVLVGKSFFEAWREYRKTGKWPRNEAFIARMKKPR
jgi:hypothetical protein